MLSYDMVHSNRRGISRVGNDRGTTASFECRACTAVNAPRMSLVLFDDDITTREPGGSIAWPFHFFGVTMLEAVLNVTSTIAYVCTYDVPLTWVPCIANYLHRGA